MKREDGITPSVEMSALTEFGVLGKRIAVSLELKPIFFDEIGIYARPDVVYTYGHFALVYGIPNAANPKFRSKHSGVFYFADADILATPRFRGYNAYYRSYEDFMERAHEHPFQRLVSQCSTLDENTFRLAKENPYVPIPFVLDLAKYHKVVGSPFVTTKEVLDIMDAAKRTKNEMNLRMGVTKWMKSLEGRFDKPQGV